jgi:hypothetical protein
VRWKNLVSHGEKLGELAIAYGLRRLDRAGERVASGGTKERPGLKRTVGGAGTLREDMDTRLGVVYRPQAYL